MNTADLLSQHCRHQTIALNDTDITAGLSAVDGWMLQDGFIAKSFSFANYYETLAFVNGIAFLIHAEDHHPEMMIGYNRCLVKFNTHSVNGGKGGISENDFICTAKIDALLQRTQR